MRKKKGFTLIELLAVIVVLAIILVLSIPKILEIIENAEKQAYKESAELMAHTAQIQYNSDEITGSAKKIPEEGIVYTFEEGVQKVSGDFELLKFKGDKPYSGTITLTKDKKVIIEKLVSKNKKWCAIKEEGEKQARVGRSTDPEFECIIEPEQPIVDKDPCLLATNDDKTIYYIDSPSDLYAFSQSVNSGKDYSGKTVKVRNDIDMSTAKGECVTSFDPIGTADKPFNGTFDGGAKTISNLTINKSGGNYIALFGYVSDSKIYGFTLDNINVTGDGNIAAIVGKVLTSTDVIKELAIINSTLTAQWSVSGIAAEIPARSETGYVGNFLIKDTNIGRAYNYGMLSYNDGIIKNSIIENMGINSWCADSCYNKTTNPTYDTYFSNDTSKNDINFYEAAGLDTWIGGDDDGSGYYFDYDESGAIVLKSTKKDPISKLSSLSGSGTEASPYLIKTEKDWKIVSAHPTEEKNYRVENNLDFSTNKYYMLGSAKHPFKGNINGNMKQISNITINASQEASIGMFGNVEGSTLHEFDIDNVKIYANNAVGSLIGTATDVDIYVIDIYNGTISSGGSLNGGLIGTSTTGNIKVKEVMLDNMTISANGTSRALGLIGSVPTLVDSKSINNILIKNTSLSGYNYGMFTNDYNHVTSSIIENMSISSWCADSCYSKTTSSSYDTYTANATSTNDINFYEAAGLDTWIGGDNNSTNYYFDYNESGNIVLRSTKDYPISPLSSLSGSGTEASPYLIKNEKDWKIVSAHPKEQVNYRVEGNLNFSTNKYYMLGSESNPFQGNINGNMKQISNITISASQELSLGMFGTANGAKIHEFDIDNITIHARNTVGSLIGTATDVDVYVIDVYNGKILSYDSGSLTAGLIGTSTTGNIKVKEIILDEMTISTNHSRVMGLIGSVPELTTSGSINNILIKNATMSGYNYGMFNNDYQTSNSIVEKMTISSWCADSCYNKTASGSAYYSELTTVNGGVMYGAFSSTLIGDLDYYAGKIETLYNGDANGTGYFFDYVQSKEGIYLVKAYTPVETEEPTEQTGCTITYGTEESGCFLYKNGVHGNYVYRPASSEETGTGAACTGTGREAAFRRRIYYNCN